MNIGPYCHFAQRDGVRAVFRRALLTFRASGPILQLHAGPVLASLVYLILCWDTGRRERVATHAYKVSLAACFSFLGEVR